MQGKMGAAEAISLVFTEGGTLLWTQARWWESFLLQSLIPLLPYVSATSWAKLEFLFNCGKIHMKRNWPS